MGDECARRQMSSIHRQHRMPDARRACRDLVVGLRMAEIDHFIDRQKPRVERSWARGFWPHTHTLSLKYLATEGTDELRFRFDEQELAGGAGLMRIRDAIVACQTLSSSGAPTRPAHSIASRTTAAWLRPLRFRGALDRLAVAARVHQPAASCSSSR
jgi:hypothetical protein